MLQFMNKARILICAMVMMLLACGFSAVGAYANGSGGSLTAVVSSVGPNQPELSMENATGDAGGVVELGVQLTGNPGIIGMTLEVNYGPTLSLTAINNGEALQGLEMTKPGELKSGCRIHWDTADLPDSSIKDGNIVKLTFAISQEASAGEICAVSVSPVIENGQPDVYDRDLNTVDLQSAGCSVTVISSGTTHAEHKYGEWKTVTQPTCTKQGSREKTCSECGNKVTETIKELGHSWDSGKITKEPTYDATGVRTLTCQRCGITRSETIAELTKTSLDNATVVLPVSVQYSGKEHTPAPTVKVAGKTLKQDTDYTVSYANNTNVGTATVTITGKGNCTGTAKGTFEITGAPVADENKSGGSNAGDNNPSAIASVPMHRLYNPNSGEHFYTADDSEAAGLAEIGWNDEGFGWTAPKTSSTPVYRLYNANAGDHHYTMSGEERDTLVSVGWSYEGVGWYSDDSKSVPLYRQYNPNAVAGSHNYTTSKDENDMLVSVGWNEEGIGWYGL